MSSLKICLICLRTDVELRELNYNLSDFYEELCDYTSENSAHLSCSVCESMLNKCWDFKKQCCKSDKILQNWKKKKSQPSAGNFVCNVCFMRFDKYRTAQKHKSDAHFGLYKCKICPLVTYSKMVMRKHLSKHQGVEYKCELCNGVYSHQSTYMTHLRTRHWTEHVCVWCARTFVSEKGLSAHRKNAHPNDTKIDPNDSTTATCYDCKITFVSEAVYTVHVLNTPKHRDLASAIIGCPECGLQFPCRLKLKAHRRKLHPTYDYAAMKEIQKNKSLGRSDDVRIVECKLCGKSGTHNWWLYRHYQMLHPEIPFEPVRNKKLKYLCEQCGRSFLTSTALKEHQNLHSGIKPFTCDKCPAKFRRQINLTAHLQSHLPPTRECKRCGKKFVSASNLSNHMRVHIGDRRFKCTICSKGFLHRASLNEHVRGVHHHIRRTRKNVTKTVE